MISHFENDSNAIKITTAVRIVALNRRFDLQESLNIIQTEGDRRCRLMENVGEEQPFYFHESLFEVRIAGRIVLLRTRVRAQM
jgi:hypothetical protein